MRSGPPTVRLFLLAVAATLPPLILAAILLLEPPSWLSRFSSATGLVVFTLLTAAWWAVVAIVGARGLGDDVKAMVEHTGADGEDMRMCRTWRMLIGPGVDVDWEYPG